jgi:Rad3-related DNA helicase
MSGRDRNRASRPRRGVRAAKPVAAIVSFLARHGFTLPFPERDTTEERIVSLIAGGALPPAYLLMLAERCGIDGLSLIADAAAASGERRSGTRETAASRGSEARTAEPLALGLEEAFSLVVRSLGEERPGQLEMARAVARAFGSEGVALLEAGTGTGKSLAYLVPSALHSFETGERIIVSTYTKNLQDQLFRKETRALERALSVDARAERLLGRDNYICTRKVLMQVSKLMEETSAPGLALALFVSLADGGTIDSLGALPGGMNARELVAPARCPMNACGFAERCPLVRARRRAREARILFVNHALLLTDYQQGGAVIGPYSRVVFDEAHQLERCVMENLSVKASREGMHRILEPLKLSDREDDTWKLLASELESRVEGCGSHLRRDLARDAKSLESLYAGLFHGITDSLNAGRSQRSTKTRYTDGGETFAMQRGSLQDMSIDINRFVESLKLICDTRLSSDLGTFQQEVSYCREELTTLSEAVKYLSTGADEDSVFWLDWDANGGLREMCGSPLGIDRSFADYLDSFLGSAVFTSATLSEGGSFAFLKERLGLRLLPERPIELIIPSPFPFDDNCLVLVVPGLGDPNDDGFAAPVTDLVSKLAADVARRTMVLFTSYRLLFSVADSLAKRGVDGPVFVQGAGESRETLSERFRLHPAALLLGVTSFWEGVDFPGEELEVLVIPKIPFPVPTEPIVEARSQRLSSLGEDAFGKLFLPEAILRMRQGAGRLIRRMDDRGVIVILDSRLGTRGYGNEILASLPSGTVEHVSFEECVDRIQRWFDGA